VCWRRASPPSTCARTMAAGRRGYQLSSPPGAFSILALKRHRSLRWGRSDRFDRRWRPSCRHFLYGPMARTEISSSSCGSTHHPVLCGSPSGHAVVSTDGASEDIAQHPCGDHRLARPSLWQRMECLHPSRLKGMMSYRFISLLVLALFMGGSMNAPMRAETADPQGSSTAVTPGEERWRLDAD